MKELNKLLFHRLLVLVFCHTFPVGIHATELTPSAKYRVSGVVSDFVVMNHKVYAATESGSVDIINLANGQTDYQIKVPVIKDFMGDDISPRIHAVDAIREQVLIVSQGEAGYSNLYIYTDGRLTKFLDAEKDRMLIMKARFISHDRILMAMLSNEYMLYNLDNRSIIYKQQYSTYAFSDFSLDDKKERFITADESGTIYLVSAADGKIIKEYSGGNVDKVFTVGFSNESIICGGQDRRLVVYNVSSREYYIKQKDYLVYSVALNNDGSLGAHSDSENHTILVFHMENEQDMYILNGHEKPVTKILFYNESQILSTGTGKEIFLWDLRE